jgi:hypothetical protein
MPCVIIFNKISPLLNRLIVNVTNLPKNGTETIICDQINGSRLIYLEKAPGFSGNVLPQGVTGRINTVISYQGSGENTDFLPVNSRYIYYAFISLTKNPSTYEASSKS